MNITYTLIEGGYEIESDDGSVRISQPFRPDLPGFVPYSPADAEAAAKALIAQLQAPAEG